MKSLLFAFLIGLTTAKTGRQ